MVIKLSYWNKKRSFPSRNVAMNEKFKDMQRFLSLKFCPLSNFAVDKVTLKTNEMTKKLLLLCVGAMLAICQVKAQQTPTFHEKYRPQYHFSPSKGWIGDPSGLMYYQGKYHMYWWGKVESKDLVHYQEISNDNVMQNVDSNTACFTGSALIDKNNTAGFGKNAFIAAMTLYSQDSKKQAQGIAFSHDGDKFYLYDQNPVLDIWSTEFRDPTVFWCEKTQKWVMVVAKALEKKVKFYDSDDLKHWQWISDFGPSGDSEKSWECPDFFQLPVVNDDSCSKKWVLVVSVNWAQEQYFVGDFDGKTFRLEENHPSTPLYVDKGLDYYASRTFRDYDGTLKDVVSIGWVATWDYAQQQPSQYGKGFWSVPRKLALKKVDGHYLLIQNPVDALAKLRGPIVSARYSLPVGVNKLKCALPKSNVYEMDAVFDTKTSNVFGFNLCVGEGRKLVVCYDTDSYNLVIDRTHCADVEIPKFARMAHARVLPQKDKLRMHIFIDKSSVEIFCNDGQDVFTMQTFPSDRQVGIETFSYKKGAQMDLKLWPLNSVWK